MRILSFLILVVLLISFIQEKETPHGKGFKLTCKTCHSPKGWQLDKEIYSFNHNATKLPLVGQHNQIDCKRCHPTLIFTEAKNQCNECHNDVHQATVGLDCSRCHTPVSWLVNNINEIHSTSRFPLLGAHRTADCFQCHKSESMARFDVVGINCVDCHRDTYMATTNPNHVQSGFSDDCILCHQINAFQWAGAGFNHSIFPLVQGHLEVKCTDCHKTTNFADANPDCYSCHQQDYLAATNPNHSTSGFTTACLSCHSLSPGWKPTTFNHNSFPLTMGHSSLSCTDCHIGGNYTSTSTDCYSCHQQDYLATTNPNHATSGISTACKTCHSINPGWKPATFNHTIFPLTLGHTSVACADCHLNGNYSSTSAECYSCHQQDYTATTNPNHVASGFETNCKVCHTTNPGWKPATFNHTVFPLTLGHASVACADCHKNGNYTSTSADCYSCHQTDYTSSTNPNHITLAFSTVCKQCHTTNPGWKPASYTQHDTQFFPIYSGKHRGQWDTCTDCHLNPSNYTQFNCITCHSNVHRNNNYSNAQCLSCHPRGTTGG